MEKYNLHIYLPTSKIVSQETENYYILRIGLDITVHWSIFIVPELLL